MTDTQCSNAKEADLLTPETTKVNRQGSLLQKIALVRAASKPGRVGEPVLDVTAKKPQLQTSSLTSWAHVSQTHRETHARTHYTTLRHCKGREAGNLCTVERVANANLFSRIHTPSQHVNFNSFRAFC
jgi:hypothetical protein